MKKFLENEFKDWKLTKTNQMPSTNYEEYELAVFPGISANLNIIFSSNYHFKFAVKPCGEYWLF